MQKNYRGINGIDGLDEQIELKAEGLYKKLQSKASFFTGQTPSSNLSVKNARSEKLFFSYERRFSGQSHIEIGYLRPSQKGWSTPQTVVLSSTQSCDEFVNEAFEQTSNERKRLIRHFWNLEMEKSTIEGSLHSNHRAILTSSVCSTEVPCLECKETGNLACCTCSGTGQKACEWCFGNGVIGCSACSSSGATRCSPCYGSGLVSRSMMQNVTCGRCQGGRSQVCTACYGAFSRTTQERDFQGNYRTVVTTCMGCSFGRQSCSECYGAGSISKMVSVSERCTYCYGKGSQQCSTCNGIGDVRCTCCRGHGAVSCADCQATGILSCNICYGQGTRFYEGGVVCSLTNTLGPIEFDERAKIKNRELCEILSSSVKNKDLPFGYPSISVEQISINETEPSLDYVIKTQASVPLFRADVEFFGEIFPLSSLLYGVTHFEGEQQWHERMLDLVIKRLEVTDVNSYMVTLGIANGLKSISEQNPFLESLFNQPEFFDSNVTDKEFIESSPEPVRKHDELAQLSSKVRSDVVETIVSTCQSGKVLYRFSPFLLGLVFLLSLIIMNSEGLVFIRDDATSTFSKFDPVLSIYAYQHWFDSSVFEVTGPWSFVIPEIKLWHILLPSIMVGVTSLTFLLRPYHRWRLKEINRFERIKHFVDQGLPRHQARDLVLPLCLVIAPILFTVFF